MDYAVEVHHLTKIFQPGIGFYDIFLRPRKSLAKFKALDNITLQVRSGTIFALLGPNGAGKTTLMKILATLIYPDTGCARVNGYDVTRDEVAVKRSIGMLINDETSFYWRLTGFQNLEFFASLCDIPRKERSQKIMDLCKLLEITDPHKRFQEYSTGTKQKLGLARALLRDPEIIFMDEPTRSLDPITAGFFRDFLKHQLMKKPGRTIFFITHNPYEAETTADTIGILDKGCLRAVGDMETLRSRAAMPGAPLKALFPTLVSGCHGKLF